MIILRSDRFSFAPWLQLMSRISMGVAGCSLLFLGYLAFGICKFKPSSYRERSWHVPSWDFRKIEKGLLALQDVLTEDPTLSRAIAVRAKNTRPDILYNPSSAQMLLSLKGAKEMRAAANGQTLFLQGELLQKGQMPLHGPPAPLEWSNEKSCLELTPFVFPSAQDADAVFFKASMEDEEGSHELITPFLIESGTEMGNTDSAALEVREEWFENLQSAHFWMKDAFLEIYGARNQGPEDVKIAFESKEGPHILLAKEGEFLVYQEGHWTAAPLQKAADKPLAQILRQQDGHLMMQVWDKTGFIHKTILLAPETPKAPKNTIETDFLNLRVRNNTEVSCLLGKRRLVLKAGDWWLKEDNHNWRNLKRVNEIDDFLAFKCKGELFVVDSFDKVQGRSILKGRLFDSLRQTVQIVSLPVAEGRPMPATVKHQQPPSPSDTMKKTAEPGRRVPIPLTPKGAQ